jgi:hypothetical protein
VHAYADAAITGAARLQAQRPPHGRLEAIRRDDERGAPQLAAHPQPDSAPVFEHRALDRGLLVDTHTRRGARGREQRRIEVQPPHPQRDRRRATRARRKPALGGEAEGVVADCGDRPAADGVAQPRALEDGDACGHDPLAARFLAREFLGLVEFDAQPRPSEQQRQRRAGGAAARDYDVCHGQGTKRGLRANAAR